jgi:hypothetical protein
MEWQRQLEVHFKTMERHRAFRWLAGLLCTGSKNQWA